MRKVAISTAALVVLAAAPSQAAAKGTPHPLQTAVYLSASDLSSPNLERALSRIQGAGATAVRINVRWSEVAHRGRPTGDAADPGNPAYDWDYFDRALSLLTAHGLEPLVTVYSPPDWAGGTDADPSQLALFARALTTRYSGAYHNLPRVKYWLVWNEPNLPWYLRPQRKGKRIVSPAHYRLLVNAFSDAAHAVHRDNVVVAGVLAPLKTKSGGIGAFRFMRLLLCMSEKAKPTCKARTKFDVWSVHPYASGGPTHKAHGTEGVSLGDLPAVRKVLSAAVRARHVVSSRPVQFWVTEFSWDTNPPDPLGVPLRLEARWVAEALYRAWEAGVRLLTWFQIEDEDRSVSPYQSGLYFRDTKFAAGKPKPALSAFRFPFVALKQKTKVFVWGRTPDSNAKTVFVERSSGRGWTRVATLHAARNGIFSRTLRLKGAKTSWKMRARLAGTKTHSLGFSLKYVPDRFYRAFGS